MWLHPGCYKKATPAPTSKRTEQHRHRVVLHLASPSVCVFTPSWWGLLLRCASKEMGMCSIPKSLHLLCVLVHCSGVRKLGLGHWRKLGKLHQRSYIYVTHVKRSSTGGHFRARNKANRRGRQTNIKHPTSLHPEGTINLSTGCHKHTKKSMGKPALYSQWWYCAYYPSRHHVILITDKLKHSDWETLPEGRRLGGRRQAI